MTSLRLQPEEALSSPVSHRKDRRPERSFVTNIRPEGSPSTMTLNLYVMPIIGTGTRQDPRRPKYQATLAAFDWGMYDYGDEPRCLVGIVDVTPAVNSSLTANSDVTGVPQRLDTTVGSAGTRNQIRTQLEANEIPGTWVQTTTTYREIVEVVAACCQFAQRYQGLIGGPWFTGTVHVASAFGSLSTTQQNGIIASAQSFGFSTAAIVGTATIRDVLKNIADQYLAAHMPLIMANVDLYTA